MKKFISTILVIFNGTSLIPISLLIMKGYWYIVPLVILIIINNVKLHISLEDEIKEDKIAIQRDKKLKQLCQ